MKIAVLFGLLGSAAAHGHWMKNCDLPCPEGQRCKVKNGVEQCLPHHRWHKWGMNHGGGSDDGGHHKWGMNHGAGSDDGGLHKQWRHWMHHEEEDREGEERMGEQDDDDNDDWDHREGNRHFRHHRHHRHHKVGKVLGAVAVGVVLLVIGFALGVAWTKRSIKQAIVVHAEPAAVAINVPLKEAETVPDN